MGVAMKTDLLPFVRVVTDALRECRATVHLRTDATPSDPLIDLLHLSPSPVARDLHRDLRRLESQLSPRERELALEALRGLQAEQHARWCALDAAILTDVVGRP